MLVLDRNHRAFVGRQFGFAFNFRLLLRVGPRRINLAGQMNPKGAEFSDTELDGSSCCISFIS